MGDDDDGSSITSSIYSYVYENGRRYHAYREGNYLLPNDAEEQERLDLSHHIFRLQLGGALHFAPIDRNLKRVLDLGTGTGIWAIDFADEFPNAAVIGCDLSPIQPQWRPPNCSFFVDDIESDWTYARHEAFDYIHGRGMGGSVSDWPLLCRRSLEHLNPGGWFEIQDYDTAIYAYNDPDLETAPRTREWQVLVNLAAERSGRTMNVAHRQKQWMIEAGYQDVHEEVVQVPIGTWTKDPRLKEIGTFQLEHMLSCIPAFTLAPLTRVLNYTVDEVRLIMAGVRAEFTDPKRRLMTKFRFVYGRRPPHAHAHAHAHAPSHSPPAPGDVLPAAPTAEEERRDGPPSPDAIRIRNVRDIGSQETVDSRNRP
ncbi:S-adenosyl-L-methionine-dependent methyltransferase [Dissoconium aciculare CBS 342.82]|uniref:S-adenosyl-L-methionine-dependent methyltransferase n=1 Tax=Dissoconium aciculare CBS 342.82 TaxID=1314786 RepID=A0A6J3MID8_9PEZI|nr:S-adenosyl-L-methionine-dependent methyltransferase [Dissoconium aciculare CBS 342.82]KAF1827469.1 S-adenosyl-L-methionine-dependent methyltransferase [Dissoconium aciculare CBS 342.82]